MPMPIRVVPLPHPHQPTADPGEYRAVAMYHDDMRSKAGHPLTRTTYRLEGGGFAQGYTRLFSPPCISGETITVTVQHFLGASE